MMDPGQNNISFEDFEIDTAHRRLLRGGSTVALNAKTFDLLLFLVQNCGRTVTKQEILDAVWPGQFVEEANLSVQISALRKALGEKAGASNYLVTVPGRGYRFIADLRFAHDEIVIESHKIERVAFDDQIDDYSPNEMQLPGTKRRPRYPILVLLAAAAAGILILVIYNGYFRGASREVRTLAVLPFFNQNQAAEMEYLGDGLAESVIQSLSRFPDIRVISRNSAFRFRVAEIEASEAGRRLGADAVLSGRITQAGSNLSISAELISTADNSVIWGQQFTRKTDEIERLQNDIAEAVSQRLRLASGNKPTPEREVVDPEAYRHYLLGRYYLNKLTDAGFWKARDHFERATETDPGYAPAYVGLADAYNRLSGFNALPPADGYLKSRAAAEKALELDEQLAGAHTALASVKHFYDWDWAGAEKEFQRAIALDPGNADTLQMYSYHLSALGRSDEALSQIRRAHELDPLSLEKLAGIGEALYYQRRYDEALEQYRKVLEMDPNSGFAHWAIGNAYTQKGSYSEAIAEYQQAIALSGDSPDEPASMACAYALSGNRQESMRIIRELETLSKAKHVSPVTFAFMYSALGENDRAFEWLEQAYRSRDFLLVLVKVEPFFDKLRSDPRFDRLVERVGLPK